ncbi:unnamed protein product [Adineta ricciae]|uniref:HAT C-terminal dimerisation domain-containing protein n=1 Tax=Adineta ricciae TaxID=249248 RepID=A0A815UDB1_ADIRI|nr:unnamed protein product [Adineta ricciae]
MQKSYPLISSSSQSTDNYTVEKIKFRLQNDKSNYQIIGNNISKCKSNCWKFFGFPAKRNEGDNYERIPGFVSCRNCLKTYRYTSTTGTRQLNSHPCVSESFTNSESTAPVKIQTNLNLMSKNPKRIKLNDSELNYFKSLMAKWICEDLRPFAISEDKGLRTVFQELVNFGSKYGNFDVQNIVQGADTMSNYVYTLAHESRQELKQMLKEPFENEAVCVSPDMWSDRHKQLSYLGLSCSLVTADYKYVSFDLCCRPYYEVDHTGDNLLTAIQSALELLDLNDLSKLNFVSDRGPNLVKALKPYHPIYCYAHRLNNLLKRSFFQSTQKQKQKETSASEASATSSKTNNEDDSSTSSSEDEIEYSLPVVTRKKKTKSKVAGAQENGVDHMKLQLGDLDPAAKTIIQTIVNCKKLVKYVKKAGLNKDIQEAGGVSLQQATVVRWLSLIELLESILRSYKQTKRVLTVRKQQSKIAVIDEKIVDGLIKLLKPFKKTLKLIQTGNSPSLYMVLICTLNLRKSLSSFKNLIASSDFEKNDLDESNTNDFDEDLVESEGLKILRERILHLLDLMFQLDVRHIAATLLHPKYRQLRGCSNEERNQACDYIREEMSKIIRNDQFNDISIVEPTTKKQKIGKSILEEYEDISENEFEMEENDEVSDFDVTGTKPLKSDELNKYLDMYIDKGNLSQNPLDFWRDNRVHYPILARVARKIHCISATSSAVERQFSSAGFILNERRTSLDPEHIDNILCIRALERLKQ